MAFNGFVWRVDNFFIQAGCPKLFCLGGAFPRIIVKTSWNNNFENKLKQQFWKQVETTILKTTNKNGNIYGLLTGE